MRISDWSSDVCSSDLERPGLIGRDAYTYAHIPIVAGIIVLAVANEQVLAHPTGHSATSLFISLLGGGLLFITGTMTFKRLTGATVGLPRSHLAGLPLALFGLLDFADPPPPLQLHIAASGTSPCRARVYPHVKNT